MNGDDPEACVRAARLAFGFRQAFHKDVVIDLVCYRRHGHNEGDDPSYTQPLMYALIDAKRSVRKLYTESLVRRGDISLEEAEQALDDFSARLQAALDETRAEAESADGPSSRACPSSSSPTSTSRPVATGIDATLLSKAGRGGAHGARGLRDPSQAGSAVRAAGQGGGRRRGRLGPGEALALGSLLVEGTNVRLTGQDTRRGTFSQRHAVLVDHATGQEFVPLAALGSRAVHRPRLAPVRVRLRRASSTATRSRPSTTWWPGRPSSATSATAPRSSSTTSWWPPRTSGARGRVWSSCCPHGYEGQGPEHSSARIERFLTMSARGNIRVAEPTTAAQYFHLLRSQVRGPERRPLVVFTPKSLLRSRVARSPDRPRSPRGSFAEVLDDPAAGRRGLRSRRACAGWCCAPARSPTTPWGGGTSWVTAGAGGGGGPGRAALPLAHSGHPRRARPATRAPMRWCGCRRSPRTWGPGTSSTAGCTGCCGTPTRCAM